MSSSSAISGDTLHKLIQESFKGRDRAYAPYSKFNVGAALLAQDGSIIIGCNIENASTPAGICAERTAMVKAISSGTTSFLAVAVTSALTTPTISPCGICRQFMREFLPLSTPILMVSATYPMTESATPNYIDDLAGHIQARSGEADGLGLRKQEEKSWSREVTVLTLEELLPMSFGPEQLEQGTK